MPNIHPWLLLSYKAPSEPSTVRVRVWRTLKALGVVYIQQSVCVMPDTIDVRKKVQTIQKLIESHEGEALLLEVNEFSTFTEQELIARFNKQRSAEYNELLEGCDHFLLEIETETQKGKFTFHEVEENEAELGKLKRWHKKIVKRDFFRSDKAESTQAALETCEQQFNQFVETVYATEGRNEGEI